MIERSDSVLYYSGHPDLSNRAPAGYASHMNGVITGFRQLGYEVDEEIRGSQRTTAEPRPSTRTPALRDRMRRVLPGKLWRAARDVRHFTHDRRGRLALSQRSTTPSLVYERLAFGHRACADWAAEAGVLRVVEINMPWEERSEFGLDSPFDFWIRRRTVAAIESADLVVFVSEALRDSYRRSFPAQIQSSIVGHNAVEPTDFDVTEHDIAASRSFVRSLVADSAVIGFVGSLMPWHGIEHLLDAMPAILDACPESAVVLVGDGEHRAALERRTAELGLAGHVFFTGAVDRVEAISLIKCFDVAVMLASNTYGSPVKLFEYLAAGCPTVAPNVEPVREIIDADLAWLVDPDPNQIAAAICAALSESTDPARAERQASWVFAHHTWRSRTTDVLAALQDASE